MLIHSFALNYIDLNNVINIGTVFIGSSGKIPCTDAQSRFIQCNHLIEIQYSETIYNNT